MRTVTSPATQKRLETLAAAADYTGLSTKTLRRRIAAGDLPAYRVRKGRAIRVDLNDVDALFEPVRVA